MVVKVKDTAFWMACCRASDESLSLDPYAKYWVSDDMRSIYKLYLQEVSPTEDFIMCTRNRHFLDEVSRFFAAHEDAVFVNIGAGVTSYPYLLSDRHRFCEVDCEAVLNFKRERLASQSAVFPKRDITYFACDFNESKEVAQLSSQLAAWIGNAPSYFLIEGVLYYLRRDAVDNLFQAFGRIQRPGDQLGLVNWQPDFVKTRFFSRFKDFLQQRLKQELADYCLLENGYFRELQNYQVKAQTDNPQLVRKYLGPEHPLRAGDYADEQFFLLSRKN
jgi:O-methyltransferase involved in polyketide biosynthesis